MKNAIAAALAFAFVTAPAISAKAATELSKASKDKKWQALDASTPAEIAAKIQVDDDPMETFMSASSEPVYKQSLSLLSVFASVTENDHYLRAVIDRTSGAARFQFVFKSRYVGRYDAVNRANFMTVSGPVQAEVRQLRYELLGCRARGCEHLFVYAFEVPRDALQWAASNPDKIWFVRLASDSQKGDKGTHPNEIAGLLLRVDQLLEAQRRR